MEVEVGFENQGYSLLVLFAIWVVSETVHITTVPKQAGSHAVDAPFTPQHVNKSRLRAPGLSIWVVIASLVTVLFKSPKC